VSTRCGRCRSGASRGRSSSCRKNENFTSNQGELPMKAQQIGTVRAARLHAGIERRSGRR
jgi:hypothetical protein